jgi:uncharacterized membrane protein YfcA
MSEAAMIFGLDWPLFIFAFALVAFASAFQSAVGVGFGLLVAPVFALIDTALVPATVLLIGVLSAAIGAWNSRHGIRWNELVIPVFSRAPGAVVGVVMLVLLADHRDVVLIVTGLVVLLAVWITVAKVRLTPNRISLAVSAFLSGLMGSLTGIGGPPMTLIYQNAKALEVRAMLNMFFATGTLFSIVVLALAGLITARHIHLSVSLVPRLSWAWR